MAMGLGRLSLLRSLGATSLRLVSRPLSLRLWLGTLPWRLSAGRGSRRRILARRRISCNSPNRWRIRERDRRQVVWRDSYPEHWQDVRRPASSQLVSFQHPNRRERRSLGIRSSRRRRFSRRRQALIFPSAPCTKNCPSFIRETAPIFGRTHAQGALERAAHRLARAAAALRGN